jgi:adenylate cyclase
MNIRIGLCTGEVLVGSVGSNICKSFTVMGDTVNTASRLEGANKEYGTRILISEETQRLAAKWFETRQIDCIKVKGKAEPLKVFELMAHSGALNDARAELKRQFESVLLLYQEQDWERALSGLEQCLRIDPADLPSRVYRDRCQALQQSPPSGDWDGVWQLTRK